MYNTTPLSVMLFSPQKSYIFIYLLISCFFKDVVNNFPALSLDHVFLHASYSQIQRLRTAMMYYFSQIRGLTMCSCTCPNERPWLVAVLGWLGFSLHMVFHVSFSKMVPGFWEGKTQCTCMASTWIAFVDVLLTKARPTAKSRVQMGEDHPGQDFWEAWFII